MSKRVILDVDTGTDDAVAIMMAALHPDIELVACTTVWGNTTGAGGNVVSKTADGTVQSTQVFGRVPPQLTPSAGVYTDTVTVTVTY